MTQREVAVAHGFRSGLEDQVAAQLKKAGQKYGYEELTMPWVPSQKLRKFTPDFILYPQGIVVETKGRWVTADRQKVKAIRAQHPDVDFRMVFSNPNQRISKISRTTYADYCSHLGIPYAKGFIPEAWLKEPPNLRSLKALQELENG